MSRYILAAVAVLIPSAAADSGPPPNELVRKLTAAIREHCPDAMIDVKEGAFIAKHGTMTFTVHARSKTGEIFPKTREQEGPNFKGFVLSVTQHDGEYQGAAAVPQSLREPYYERYINAAPDGRGGHYFVAFSYGGSVDPKLKGAIFGAVPRTQSRANFATEPGE